MTQMPMANQRRRVGTRAAVGIVIAVVAVAAIAVYYFATAPSPSATSGGRTQTPSAVQVIIPSGAGVAPSNWNQSHIISNLYFSPDSIVVMIGVNSTVVWTNKDSVPHTVTSFSVPSGEKSFDSGILNPGGTYSKTFQTSGVYRYYCTIHPWMGGQVTVKGS